MEIQRKREGEEEGVCVHGCAPQPTDQKEAVENQATAHRPQPLVGLSFFLVFLSMAKELHLRPVTAAREGGGKGVSVCVSESERASERASESLRERDSEGVGYIMKSTEEK